MNDIRKFISFALAFLMLIPCIPVNAYNAKYSEKVNLPGLEVTVDEKNILRHGTIVFEAEDIIGEKSSAVVVADEKASGEKAVHLQNIQWNLEDVPNDDIYAKIYLGDGETEGTYKIWSA